MIRTIALAAAAILATTAVASAHNHQRVAQAHEHHGSASTAAEASAATEAFQAANDKMHRDMSIAFTGNPDADFVRGMIPHHQGAIDMARIVLAYGKDPQIRKLAEDIIKAQENEIAQMKEWLAKNGH